MLIFYYNKLYYLLGAKYKEFWNYKYLSQNTIILKIINAFIIIIINIYHL